MLTLPDDREKLNSLDLTLRNIISFESDRDVRKVRGNLDPTFDVDSFLTIFQDHRRRNYYNGSNSGAYDPREQQPSRYSRA